MASQQIFFLLLSSPIRHGLPGDSYSRLESLEQLSVIKEVKMGCSTFRVKGKWERDCAEDSAFFLGVVYSMAPSILLDKPSFLINLIPWQQSRGSVKERGQKEWKLKENVAALL